MKTSVIAVILGLCVLSLSAIPVAAERAQTETIRFSGADEPFELGQPLCGLPGEAVFFQTFSGVLHTTVGPDGQAHTTITVHGDVTVVVPGGPTYTGHYADTQTDNLNLRNETHVVTSNNVLRAPDGSTLGFLFIGHFNVSAGGVVHDSSTFTCTGGE